MYNIEYEIGLNEQGRPYIILPENYEQRPEDRFFALEICRYILQDLLNRRSADLDPHTIGAIDESERLLGQLGDEVAKILYGQMKISGEFMLAIGVNYHIEVPTIEERDILPEKNILFNNKIFDRVEGLKVWVIEDKIIYELKDGITNENWVKI